MSYPFFIWTMQRTGGTALTDLLMEMSEHKSADHEPFNWARAKPRQFWPITEAWQKTKNVATLTRSLRALFADKYLIKHCYEIHTDDFNQFLMEASARVSYRHIILYRRDEYARLISKYIAESHGTWFKDYAERVFDEVAEGRRKLGSLPVDKMVAHYMRCRNATEFIRSGLTRLGVDFKEIYYEDLYSGDAETRLKHVHDLLDFLGFTAADIEKHAALIDQKIFHSGQNTGGVARFVPNLDQVREALATVGCHPRAADGQDSRSGAEPGQPAEAPEASPTEQDGATASEEGAAPATAPAAPHGPRAKLRAEIQRLVETHSPKGAVLEIAVDERDLATPSIAYFTGAERHVIGLGQDAERDGVTFHGGGAHDMRELFPDGKFGVVISNRSMAGDARFLHTAEEIRRVLAPGGLAIFITPCFSMGPNDAGVVAVGRKGNPVADVTVTYRVHATPDYWRISPQAMKNVILDGFEVQEVRVKMMPPFVFGVGLKAA